MLTIINQNFSPETPKRMNETRHIKMLIDDISEPRETQTKIQQEKV